MKKLVRIFNLIWFNKEALIWIIALILLAADNPGSHHYTLCPFHHAGLAICPGCGLGRSVTLFLHGNVVESLQMHPMGIPAVLILVYRSARLILRKENKKSLHKIYSYA